MHPARVLYVLNSPGGGATQGIIELIRRLPRNLFEPYVVIPSPPSDAQRDQFEALKVKTAVIPMGWWNKKTFMPLEVRPIISLTTGIRTGFHVRTIRGLLHQIRQWEIDLVHSGSAMILDGALAARLAKIPHVWHIKEFIGRGALTEYWLPNRWLAAVITGLSDHVLVMSQFIGDFFQKWGYGSHITVVPDGVDWSVFMANDMDSRGCALRRQLDIADDGLLVGMVASLTAMWKNHELFIEMAGLMKENHPNVCFVAFGPEPSAGKRRHYTTSWDYYQGLKRQVETAGLTDRFLWAGFCTDIPVMMSAIDILVHPCANEPFGRIAIEAMAAGRPVVGPASGGIGETITDGETGLLVKPEDAEQLCQAVSQLVSNAEYRRRLGQNGRIDARKRYSIEDHVAQVTAVYEQILSKRLKE